MAFRFIKKQNYEHGFDSRVQWVAWLSRSTVAPCGHLIKKKLHGKLSEKEAQLVKTADRRRLNTRRWCGTAPLFTSRPLDVVYAHKNDKIHTRLKKCHIVQVVKHKFKHWLGKMHQRINKHLWKHTIVQLILYFFFPKMLLWAVSPHEITDRISSFSPQHQPGNVMLKVAKQREQKTSVRTTDTQPCVTVGTHLLGFEKADQRAAIDYNLLWIVILTNEKHVWGEGSAWPCASQWGQPRPGVTEVRKITGDK